MASVRLFFLRWALLRCQTRLQRGNFSYSGKEGEYLDGFTVLVGNQRESGFEILFDNLIPQGIIGRAKEGDRYIRPCGVSNQFVATAPVRFAHHYRGSRIGYDRVSSFFWGMFTLLPVRHHVANLLYQTIYNRVKRFDRDRVALLKKILNYYLKDAGKDQFIFARDLGSEIDLFTAVHGMRAFGHAKGESEYERFRLLVQGLVASGDLESVNSRIRITGQALRTIQDHDTDRARYRNGLILNFLLMIFTAVLAVSAVFQVLDTLGYMKDLDLHQQK